MNRNLKLRTESTSNTNSFANHRIGLPQAEPVRSTIHFLRFHLYSPICRLSIMPLNHVSCALIFTISVNEKPEASLFKKTYVWRSFSSPDQIPFFDKEM